MSIEGNCSCSRIGRTRVAFLGAAARVPACELITVEACGGKRDAAARPLCVEYGRTALCAVRVGYALLI